VFDFAAVDVVLGLIFLYLVLALICSALNETVSALLAWRAKMLRTGLANLLAGDVKAGEKTGEQMVEALFDHPLMRGLIRRKQPRLIRIGRTEQEARKRYPSYIPARTFVAALLSKTPAELVPPPGLTKAERKSHLANAAKEMDEAIAKIESKPVREALTALRSQAGGDMHRFQHAAETWYDDVMERVSGWYRRRVQLVLWILGIFVVLSLNADTIQIGRALWTDKTVRAAVSARASDVAKCPDINNCNLDKVAQNVKDVQSLDIPLGWTNGEAWPDDWWPFSIKLALKLLGLLMTVAALSLGAPFWFDILSKVARVRSAGAPPPPTGGTRTGEGSPPRAGDPPPAPA
jgi:hypothetical protein